MVSLLQVPSSQGPKAKYWLLYKERTEMDWHVRAQTHKLTETEKEVKEEMRKEMEILIF